MNVIIYGRPKSCFVNIKEPLDFKKFLNVKDVLKILNSVLLSQNGKCRFNAANVGATDSGFTDIKSKSESDLQSAVATVGPIAVAIDASHMSFQLYKSGVYHEFFCSETRLDHGVLAVGYGTESGKDYWLVKNR